MISTRRSVRWQNRRSWRVSWSTRSSRYEACVSASALWHMVERRLDSVQHKHHMERIDISGKVLPSALLETVICVDWHILLCPNYATFSHRHRKAAGCDTHLQTCTQTTKKCLSISRPCCCKRFRCLPTLQSMHLTLPPCSKDN